MSVVKDIVEAFVTRIKAPFFGAYVLSWATFNWEAILRISEKQPDLEVKIEAVSRILGVWSFAWPVVIALAILVISPFLNAAIAYLVSWAHVEQIKAQSEALKQMAVSEFDQKIAVQKKRLQLSRLESEANTIESVLFGEEHEDLPTAESDNLWRKPTAVPAADNDEL